MKRSLGFSSALLLWFCLVVPMAAQTNVPPTATPTATPAAVPAAPTPAATTATEPDSANTVQELITVDEAPLPDAIKILARQAGINFQFDPKIVHGTPGPDGKVPPPVTVSFRWENVTALQALMALLDNNGLQLITDPRTKIARITTRDEKALEPLISKVIQLNYANPTNVVELIRATLSTRSKISADIRTSKLIIVGTELEIQLALDMLKTVDVASRQVLIETQFLETTANPKTSKGIDWSGTLSGQNITFGNGISSGSTLTTVPGTPTTTSTTLPGGRVVTTTSNPSFSSATVLTNIVGAGTGGLSLDTARGFFPNTGFLNADGVKAVLSMLNNDADTRSIATPRAVVLEGVPTELAVVRNIPVFEEQQGAVNGGTAQPNTVKPNYALEGPKTGNGTPLNEVGIKLLVTPRVMGESDVFLDLKPEISTEDPVPASVTLGGRVSESPIFNRRKLSTQAMVPSGNTLVLGGLLSEDISKTSTKVPLLGDIPVLGLAFRHDTKERNTRNLMIFVTPTIIRSSDFQPRESARDFLQVPPGEPTDKEESALDRGKPYDWSNLRK